MPSLQTIALFMVSALALNITPGPSVLFLLSRCMREGRRAAVVSAFGLATASLVQGIGAALGLSALFIYSPLAFAVMKYCGAGYLIYLGIRSLLSGGLADLTDDNANLRRPSLASAYLQGFLTDLLNPKLIIFFFSFLPQFVDPARGDPRVQMLVFGLLVAARNDVRLDAQSRTVSSAHWLRLAGASDASCWRMGARSVRRTRDHTGLRTVGETDRAGGTARPPDHGTARAIQVHAAAKRLT